jgi:hypothetical protein
MALTDASFINITTNTFLNESSHPERQLPQGGANNFNSSYTQHCERK